MFNIRNNSPQLLLNLIYDNFEYFVSPSKSILFIGVRKNCEEEMMSKFLKQKGHSRKIICVDIFKQNCFTVKNSFDKWGPICADIRCLPFRDKSFDISVWNHGPEHLFEPEIPDAIKELERIAKEIVFLGTPKGNFKQGALYGNQWEEHKSHLEPEFFQKLGYTTHIGGYNYEHLRHILAYKILGKE